MLEKTFNPQEVEGRIYAQWEASGAFKAGRRPDAEDEQAEQGEDGAVGAVGVHQRLRVLTRTVRAGGWRRSRRSSWSCSAWVPGCRSASAAVRPRAAAMAVTLAR